MTSRSSPTSRRRASRRLAAPLARRNLPPGGGGHSPRKSARRDRDYDALEHVLGSILRNQNKFNWGSRGDMFGERPRAEVLALRAALHTRLVEFREAAGKDLAPLLREEMRPVVKYYEALKQRAGVLDFLDLLLVARDLVRDNADVRADLQQRFTPHFYRRVPGYRSAAGGDSVAAGGRRSEGIRMAQGPPDAGQVVHRR